MYLERAAVSAGPTDSQRLVRFTRRRSVQRYARLVHRMVQMSPGELADRLRRTSLGRRLRGTGAAPPVVLPTPLDASGLRAALDARFLFGPAAAASLATQLLAVRPDAARALCEEARALEAQGVPVFGARVALDPDHLDWQADPASGRRFWPSDAALDEAGAVELTRAGHEAGADVKYVWELNRHQFLVTLACAALLEGDPRLATRALRLVDGWLARNPTGDGVNWASGLEVGLRSIAWLWVLPFVSTWPAFTDEIAARWFTGLAEHYEFLRNNLSTYADPTNHLIGELTALWMLAVVFPELPGAGDEAERAMAMLTAEAQRQVLPDGVSREQSVGYHCFVLEFYLQVVALARRTGTAVSPAFEARVRGMLGFLDRVLGAGGPLPQIGDGDEGRGMPYPRPVNETERAEALLAVGARLFDVRDWSQGESLRSELPLWLLGREAVAALSPDAPDRSIRPSALFAEGGYAFLEAETRRGTRLQLTFDCGGLGYLGNGAHEHADALGVVLKIGRHLVLGDPGTGCYTGTATVRDRLRGTASHNTVTVDGLDQADVFDTFKWINPPRTALLRWLVSPDLDHVAAEHDGYERMRRPVRHRREVLFVRPDYWIVADHLSGPGDHVVSRWFHFPPSIRLAFDGTAVSVDAQGLEDAPRLVFPRLGSRAASELLIEQADWSPSYGRVISSPCLRATSAGPLPMTLVSLILPGAWRVDEDETGRIGLRGEDGTLDTLGVGPGGWLAYQRRDAAGRVLRELRNGNVVPAR
jgi:heparinase II/III-like protein